MLYSLLAAVLILSFLLPVTALKAFEKGFNMTHEDSVNLVENPVKTVKKAVKKHEFDKETKKKQENIERLLSNIDKYDGTSVGQEKI